MIFPDAACAGADPALFYPERDYREAYVREAVAICTACPARAECLELALTNEEAHGVWGGTTPVERARILATRPKVLACRHCDTTFTQPRLGVGGGGYALYCSDPCRDAVEQAYQAEYNAARDRAKPERICEVCGGAIDTKHVHGVTCSSLCAWVKRRAEERKTAC